MGSFMSTKTGVVLAITGFGKTRSELLNRKLCFCIWMQIFTSGPLTLDLDLGQLAALQQPDSHLVPASLQRINRLQNIRNNMWT